MGIHAIAIEAMNKAVGEREHYQRRRAEKVKSAWKVGILGFIPFILVGALCGLPLGVILGVIWGLITKCFGVPDTVIMEAFPRTVPIGIFTELVGTFIFWIYKNKKKLE